LHQIAVKICEKKKVANQEPRILEIKNYRDVQRKKIIIGEKTAFENTG